MVWFMHYSSNSSVLNPNTQQLATRMATLGTIKVFNPSSEGWNIYCKPCDQYMIVNEIKEDKEIVATFLTSIGSKTYNVARGLRALVKPSSTKLTDFVYLSLLRFLAIVPLMTKKQISKTSNLFIHSENQVYLMDDLTYCLSSLYVNKSN